MQTTTRCSLMAVIGCTFVLAGCPTGKGGDDMGMEDSDAGYEEMMDGGMYDDEYAADAGEWAEEVMDAGMEEIDDCTAAEAGDEMNDEETGQGLTCAPQEDEDMCFEGEYDWEIRCANETCAPEGALCFRHEDSLAYNECWYANDITAFCTSAEDHIQDDGGPIIYSVEYVEVDSDNIATFEASVYYDGDGSFGSLYSSNLVNLGTSQYTYSEGASSGYHPSLESSETNPGFHTLTFYMQLASDTASTLGAADFAVYLNDGDLDGNAYCFTNAFNTPTDGAVMPRDAWTHANNNGLGDLYEEPEDCEPSE